MDDETKDYLFPPRVVGDSIRVELCYPRIYDVQFVKVGLMDVRAADDIRISYDYERDGWRIEQASVSRWGPGDDVCDPCWKEAAFIPAWQFDTTVE
jgi:hypothetical protein